MVTLPAIYLLIIIGYGFFMYVWKDGNPLLLILSGIYLVGLGLFMTANGINDLQSSAVDLFSAVTFGLAFISLSAGSYDIIKENN